MTALVTGATGFLGRHLLAALRDRGTETIALCRRPETIADLAGPTIRPVRGDVRDGEAVARLLPGVDVVYHLAAVRNRPRASVEAMRQVNEEATIRLARRAVDAGARRFVHASTALVFGPSAAPLDERALLHAEDESAGSYVATKARAVAALRALRSAGAPVAIVHPAVVYGPDHPSHPNRVTGEIRRLLRRPAAFLLGAGAAPRDVVHVDDVVAALLAAARPDLDPPDVIAAAGPLSHRDLARLAATSAKRRRPLLVSLPVSACDLAARIADRLRGRDRTHGAWRAVWTATRSWRFRTDGLRDLLGRDPVPAEAGVARTVDWLLSGAGRR